MNRSRPALALVLLTISIAACMNAVDRPRDVRTVSPFAAAPSPQEAADPTSRPSPIPPSSTPSISPSATPSRTGLARDRVLAADGIGPYVIGTRMSELRSRALLRNIARSVHCGDAHRAEAAGPYAEQLSFTFVAGRLTSIHTNSRAFVTPSGARVGMTLTSLRRIYGSRGRLIAGVNGNKAFSVRVPPTALAVVFYLDPTNTKAASIGAGEARPLEDAARAGEGC